MLFITGINYFFSSTNFCLDSFNSVFCIKFHKMGVIFILIGLSLIVAIIALITFFWNVKSGQYDDDYTPSVRMLFDDEPEQDKNKE